ncbi:MAG TPA: threonine synthase [Ktedonobacterales bacterium]|nr:threonine synthase [Ktedonobacterales bacterium]
MSVPSRISVRVPATSANLGPGFDCLGMALNLSSTFEVEVLSVAAPADYRPAIEITSAWGDDPAIASLPDDAQNLFYHAFTTQLAARQMAVPATRIRMSIGVPPGRGLGSSATAVVGGVLAAEALAGRLPSAEQRQDLLDATVALEHGTHADNVAAALLGGLVVTVRDQQHDAWRAIRVPLPEGLRAVLFVPTFSMDTVAGRKLLPERYSRADAVANSGRLALLLASLATGDLDALNLAMRDCFHEPYRAQLFPQLPDLLEAARDAGAQGACLSGGGPTILALAKDNAEAVAAALARRAAELEIEGRVLIVAPEAQGASVSVGALAEVQPALSCPECARFYALERQDYRCACGNPLDVALGSVGAERDAVSWKRLFDERLGSVAPLNRSGVWRFRELLLPLPEVVPVCRPEGQTNLYPVGRDQADGGHQRIGEFVGLNRLWLKHEGENPTGSFKDRGMTVGVSIAKWLGASAVACASTGNTSASMASYAAQAGMRAIVLLPEGKVAHGKLSQAIGYGAEIQHIAGDFDQAMQDVERMCLEQGIYLLNSLNPFRILGQQSLAFELAQQLGWDAPDWVVLPAGNLGNTSALGMGLLRAYQLGLISRLPRIASVQASGANPFYRSYQDGFAAFEPVKASTLATAINIGNPVSFARARTVIQATNGVVAQVTDDEILRAKAMIDRAGIGCEPASAASVAGTRQLVASGVIAPDARVVAVLTGSMLKDPASITLAQEAAAVAVEVAAC